MCAQSDEHGPAAVCTEPTHLRTAKALDLERILAIRDEAIPDFFGPSWFAGRPDGVDTFALVVESAGRVEGFLYYRLRPEGLYVECLAVSPFRRGLGLGRLLMQGVIAAAPTHERTAVRLHVRTFNEEAKKLYFSLGFFQVAAMNYFGEPALLLRYDLGN